MQSLERIMQMFIVVSVLGNELHCGTTKLKICRLILENFDFNHFFYQQFFEFKKKKLSWTLRIMKLTFGISDTRISTKHQSPGRPSQKSPGTTSEASELFEGEHQFDRVILRAILSQCKLPSQIINSKTNFSFRGEAQRLQDDINPQGPVLHPGVQPLTPHPSDLSKSSQY
jgi:hypothetical protein